MSNKTNFSHSLRLNGTNQIIKLKRLNLNINFDNLLKLIHIYSNLKQAYNIKAAKGKEEYNKELAKYNAGLSSTSFEPTAADAKVASSVSSIISADKSKKRPAEDGGDEKKVNFKIHSLSLNLFNFMNRIIKYMNFQKKKSPK